MTSRPTARLVRLGAIALLGLGALAFAGCSAPSPAPESTAATADASGVDPYAPEQTDVNVMIWRTPAAAPFFIAQDEGISAEYGLEYTIGYAESSAAAVSAVVGGTTDITSASLWPVVSAIQEGLDLKIIGEQFRQVVGAQFLETLPGSGIESIEDLGGKRIGVVGLNGGADLGIKYWYEQNGLDWSTIEFVNLGFGEMGQALQTGAIDAGTFAGASLIQAREELGSVTVFDFQVEMPKFPGTSFIVRGDWAEANPNTVAAFQCSVLVKGGELAREDDELYATSVMNGLGWERDVVDATLKFDFVSSNDPEVQQYVPDLMHNFGLIADEIDITDYLIPLPEDC